MPPRPITRTTEVDEQEVATRHAQLLAAVARKRMRDEIEEMEAELAGRRRITYDSPTPSRSSGSDIPVRARALAPPIFTGKTLGELRRHIQGAIVYFDAIDEQNEARRVATSASYLREEALSEWTRLGSKKPNQRRSLEVTSKYARRLRGDGEVAVIRMLGSKGPKGLSKEPVRYLNSNIRDPSKAGPKYVWIQELLREPRQ